MIKDFWILLSISLLLVLSVFILKSVDAGIFPLYFVYIVVSIAAFWFFSGVGYEILSIFSSHFYVASIFLLLLTLIIGRVTSGVIRWIPLGPFTLQPAEIVRPFLIMFFASYLGRGELKLNKFIKILILLIIPAFLILVQPSLLVSVLTVGFFGVLLAGSFNKKYILIGLALVFMVLPVFWFTMAPYQKARLESFLNPSKDPLGAGYNSLQSAIAVGSGGFFGKGLGRGVQTQLSFLPEKQTDFIFAAVGEEMGVLGIFLVLAATFVILFRLTFYMESATSPSARAYISGFLVTYLAQVFIHAGMNMGMMPVTGLPYPLVSAGGSSLLATMIGLGIAVGAYRR